MPHNLGFCEQLMKIDTQIRDTILLESRNRIARLAALVKPTLVADADGASIIRNTMRPNLQGHSMLAHSSILTGIEVIANATKMASQVVTK